MDTYYKIMSLGAKKQLEILVTFDFKPGLNCIGEYDLILHEKNYQELTKFGFGLFLKGGSDWGNIDFYKIMVYLDRSGVNLRRCS